MFSKIKLLLLSALVLTVTSFTAVDTLADVYEPSGIERYDNGYLFPFTNLIVSMDGNTYAINIIAGQAASGSTDGDNTDALFSLPGSISVHPSEEYALIVDAGNERIRKMGLLSPYTVSTAAGSTAGYADGSGTNVQFSGPRDVIISPDGTKAVIVESTNHMVRLMDLTAEPYAVVTLAGQTTSGFTDATGTNAQFFFPRSAAFYSNSAEVLIGDSGNSVIRHVTVPGGLVTTFCGTGVSGDADGDCDTTAQFSSTSGMVLTSDDSTLYVADYTSAKIRAVNINTMIASTAAGTTDGYTDGDVSTAQLSGPYDLTLSADESMLVFTDETNDAIRALISDGSSAPSSVPTQIPTSLPTTSSPTAVPTNTPSAPPTTEPSPAPTSMPTLLPTAATAEHIYVHAVDIHGDGWGEELYLAVQHHNIPENRRLSGTATTSYYSLNCACKVIRLFSESGGMIISMHRNTTTPGPRGEHVPYEWEALFAIGYSDGVTAEQFNIFGGVDTEVVIDNWNVASVFQALDIDANAPKNKCIPPPPPPKPAPSPSASSITNSTEGASADGDDSETSPPSPLVNVRLTLHDDEGNAWCDDSGSSHVFTCSKEHVLSPDATIPNLLTYPRYFISDGEGRKLLQQGTMRVAIDEDVRDVKLPREGSFVFSVSGHYTATVPDRRVLTGDSLSWDFCATQGHINERLHFNMVHGVCKPHSLEELDDELSCAGEWSAGMQLTTPIHSLSVSDKLSDVRFGLEIGIFVAAAVGAVALMMILTLKYRRPLTDKKRVQFTALDSTEHVL